MSQYTVGAKKNQHVSNQIYFRNNYLDTNFEWFFSPADARKLAELLCSAADWLEGNSKKEWNLE